MTPEASAIHEMLGQYWPFMAVVGLLAAFFIWLLVFLCEALQNAGRKK